MYDAMKGSRVPVLAGHTWYKCAFLLRLSAWQAYISVTYIAGTMAAEIKKLGKVEKYIGKVGNYLAIRNLFEHRCRSTCTEAQMLTTAEWWWDIRIQTNTHPCLHVTECQRNSVATSQRHNVPMFQHNNVPTFQCYNVQTFQRPNVPTLWRYNISTLQQPVVTVDQCR